MRLASSGMTTVLVPASAGEMLSSTDRLRVAVAAFLARYTGLSRTHTASDLRGFLAWCADRGLDPLAASRPQLELFVRWMQENAGSSRRRCPGAPRW